MAELLRLPAVSATATSASVSEWVVEERSSYGLDDPLAVIETDKAQVEVAAESDGVLLKALVSAGSEVDVGTPIAVLGSEAELEREISEILRELGLEPESDAAPVGSRSPAAGGAAPDRRSDDAPAREEGPDTPRLFASPLARKIAKDAGLDLESVHGTGPRGRIRRRDVDAAVRERDLAASSSRAEPVTVPVAAVGGEGEAHHASSTRMRRAIARRVQLSKQEVPHFYLRVSCRADALMILKRQLLEEAGLAVTVTGLMVKAVSAAYARCPAMNVIWADGGPRSLGVIDVGVAIATPDGLVAPVLEAVDALSISAVSSRLRDIAEYARAGTLRPDQLEGGSMTVSNLGSTGIDEFAAIINPPQSAILAVGAIREEAAVVDGQVAVHKSMWLTLSVDHRPLDGLVAAEWLVTLKDILESPIQLVC